EFRAHGLDRDLAPQFRVLREVDGAHPALAELALDDEPADELERGRRVAAGQRGARRVRRDRVVRGVAHKDAIVAPPRGSVNFARAREEELTTETQRHRESKRT